MHLAARALIDDFTVRLERAVPKLLERVVATGSAQTDDWRPDRSDVDVVVVTTRPVTAEDTDALTALHAGGRVDGLYLTPEQLAAGPDSVTSAPQVVHGRFRFDQPGDQLTWVTWLELEQGGAHPLFADTAARAALASRLNLVAYWSRVGRRGMFRARFRRGTSLVPGGAVEWIVLGPPRLVVTIEQGRVVSKSDAGRLAAEQWPEHRELIERVLRFRDGGEERFTVRDARGALALLRMCVERGGHVV